MAKTSANVSAADILGGGNPTNSFSATRDRNEVMGILSSQRDDIKAQRRELNKTLQKLNMTLADIAANDKLPEKPDKVVTFFQAQEKRDNVLELRKQRDARKLSAVVVADIEEQQKFDKRQVTPYMQKTLKLEEKQVKLLEELTGGKSGLIGKLLGGIGALAMGGGAMAGRGAGRILGRAGTALAPKLSPILSILGEVGKTTIANPGGLLKSAAKFRTILGTAFGLFKGFEGWNNAEDLLSIEGREATFIEKTGAAVGGLVDGFTFGLASWITDKLGGETMPQIMAGFFQGMSDQMDLAAVAIQQEVDAYRADPSAYFNALPSRISNGVSLLFSAISTVITDGINWLGNNVSFSGMADGLVRVFSSLGEKMNNFFANMMPTEAGTIDAINRGGEKISQVLVAGVGLIYDFVANLIAKLFQPSESAAGEGVEGQGQSIIGAVTANAGKIAIDVSMALVNKIGETLTSGAFWGGVGSILWGATSIIGGAVGQLGFYIIDGIFDALQPLLTPIVIAKAMGANVASAVETIVRSTGQVIDLTSGFFNSISSGLDKVSSVFGEITGFLSRNIAGPTSIIEHAPRQVMNATTGLMETVTDISKIFATADQAGGMFGSLIRFFDHVDTAFSLFSQGFTFLGSIGGKLVAAASTIGSVVAKFAWPLQIIFSVFDFFSGFTNAAENLGIDPAKLTFSDKLISGFGSVIGGIVDFPVNALSWLATTIGGWFGVNIDRVENLGQVFGFENTSRLLNSYLGAVGGQLGKAGDFITSFVMVPVNMFKWGVDAIAGLFGFDVFEGDPSEHLNAAGSSWMGGAKSLISFVAGIPWKIATWTFNKIAGLFGFDPQIEENFDSFVANTLSNMPSIGEIIGDTVTKIGEWMADIFSWQNISTQIRKIVPERLADWLGLVGPAAPTIADQLKAGNTAVLNDAQANNINQAANSLRQQQKELEDDLAGSYFTAAGRREDEEELRRVVAALSSIDAAARNPAANANNPRAQQNQINNNNILTNEVLQSQAVVNNQITNLLSTGQLPGEDKLNATTTNEVLQSQTEVNNQVTNLLSNGELPSNDNVIKLTDALGLVVDSFNTAVNPAVNNNVPQATMPTTVKVPNVVVVKPNKFGNIIEGGNIRPFADGGIITKQIMFPLTDGSMGMAGEAGPEAIMPLERMRDNALGVKVSGLDTLGANIKEGAINIVDGAIIIGTSYGNKLEDLLKDNGEGEGAYPPSVLRAAVNNQPPSLLRVPEANRPAGRPATTQEIIAKKIGQAPADLSDLAELGSVSKLFESGGRGVNTVSHGRGDKGGVSYGAHQLSSKTGTMAEFLRSEYAAPFAEKFKGLMPGTDAFNRVYKEVATSAPDMFEKAQQQFIGATHYLPQVEKLKEIGLDVANRGKGVQELVYSMGVQHRGATDDIFQRALKGVDINSLTDNDIINRVMDERSKVGQYFKSSSEAVQQGVYDRFNRMGGEREKLLALTGEYTDKAREVAGNAMDKGRELAGQYGPQAKEVVGNAIDKGKEVAGSAVEKGKEILGGLTERFNTVLNQPLSPEEQRQRAEWAEFDRNVMETEVLKRNEVAAHMQSTPELHDPRSTVMEAQPPIPAPVAPAPAPVQAAENTKPQQAASPLASIPMFIDDLGMFIVSTNGVA